MTISQAYRCLVDFAHAKIPKVKHFNKIFKIEVFEPACRTTPELSQKYGVGLEHTQQVVAIQNRITSDLVWWNPARKTKPQNFTNGIDSIVDPTNGGGPSACDFCAHETLTAEDIPFGRVEGPFAVSASNLFKYGGPYQGVILFKHHSPLEFNFLQFSDLLNVSNGWFLEAVQNVENIDREEYYPLFLWNCLPRAGASQFHGHAQVMLSAMPFPTIKRESEAAEQYHITHGADSDYYADLVEAHASIGLARSILSSSADKNIDFEEKEKVVFQLSSSVGASSPSSPQPSTTTKTTATAFASICPTKDAEIVIVGDSMACPKFQMLFYSALRALIDELGLQTFNATLYNIPLPHINNNNNYPINSQKKAPAAPIVARVVSRGRLSSAASDYGGMEVFGGASIGHTDPWEVIQALETAFQTATSIPADVKN